MPRKAGEHRFVRFQVAALEYVSHFDAAPAQLACNQDRPVAGKRLLLGAHQRDGVGFHPGLHGVHTPVEEGRCGQLRITDPACFVAGRVLAARAELLTQEHVFDAGTMQRLLQRAPVELRIEAALRRGPDLGDGRNPMTPAIP